MSHREHEATVSHATLFSLCATRAQNGINKAVRSTESKTCRWNEISRRGDKTKNNDKENKEENSSSKRKRNIARRVNIRTVRGIQMKFTAKRQRSDVQRWCTGQTDERKKEKSSRGLDVTGEVTKLVD